MLVSVKRSFRPCILAISTPISNPPLRPSGCVRHGPACFRYRRSRIPQFGPPRHREGVADAREHAVVHPLATVLLRSVWAASQSAIRALFTRSPPPASHSVLLPSTRRLWRRSTTAREESAHHARRRRPYRFLRTAGKRTDQSPRTFFEPRPRGVPRISRSIVLRGSRSRRRHRFCVRNRDRVRDVHPVRQAVYLCTKPNPLFRFTFSRFSPRHDTIPAYATVSVADTARFHSPRAFVRSCRPHLSKCATGLGSNTPPVPDIPPSTMLTPAVPPPAPPHR